MKKAFVILGNQLFNPKLFEKFKDSTFFMAEDYDLCTYYKHHKHKILYFLSSMRSFRDEIKNKGFNVHYTTISDKDFKKPYTEKLELFLKLNKVKKLYMFEIEDQNFEKKLIDLVTRLKIDFEYIKSPMFLTSRNEFKEYLSNTKKPFMANFYKIQRVNQNLLIDKDNKPLGGKWSFDEENRKKIPKNIKLPKQPECKLTKHTLELKNQIEEYFVTHVGSTENFWIGTTRNDAILCLKNFINNKIEFFGDYEDAVDTRDNILFHSALSPYLNVGLLTPNEILEAIKPLQKKVKINSYEGYIRQIIGWREFIRGIYQNFSKELKEGNFFNHKRKMKSSWWSGDTGIEPLDYSIKNAIKFGWTHHIERLMIQANIMNLCEIKPEFINSWFMEMYIDSSEWVMEPNVYGMGLFSDGGIFSTKPYICGSSYFLKMMDFKKGDWCPILDGLYWRFIDKNREFFLKNPRLSMMVRVYDKIKEPRKSDIIQKAENFIKENTFS